MCAYRNGTSGHNSGLARLPAVGAELPAVPPHAPDGNAPRAVVGVVRRGGDLGSGRLGPLAQRVRLVGDDIGPERAWARRSRQVAVALPGRAEHDPAARRPVEL